MSERPRVVVLGGCNGAGKTTASRALLADALKVMAFVNADQIAQGLSGFSPESATVEASRIMLDRLHALADRRESFAFEATLAGRSYASLLREVKSIGYRVELYYFWLSTADLSVRRVAARVAAGGHDIPEETLRRRHPRSVRNFLTLYRPLADHWEVYDNSVESRMILIAMGTDNYTLTVDPRRFEQLESST